ncbi:MAG: hypothetical protein LUE98_15570 [Tannerellaceae bacterium]|nr:hypothetical protein [Tannerellaceae bacterium]MCD8178747.1 hypothetical protein [Tannerellaceae bacterium]
MDTRIKTIKKVDVQSTLLSIPVGGEVTIKNKQVKSSSIRSAIRVLNQRGYRFESSEKGLIDEVRIRRIS